MISWDGVLKQYLQLLRHQLHLVLNKSDKLSKVEQRKQMVLVQQELSRHLSTVEAERITRQTFSCLKVSEVDQNSSGLMALLEQISFWLVPPKNPTPIAPN